ncbi:LysR family transcriptional regulator [Herbaspirillum autotrophicum]|uniref:LysR family transcriptional regulator n=1 Tax=Herbaspirillum autotrophicum TaxID=180195 RepID=UPI00067D5B66|nr:LysR family transcriptional regulator [Herbaspirillum autotrophicum]
MADQISDLKLLTQLVAAGSLSKAAVHLDSSLPAVSRRLAAMEARLGVRLVERHARRFALTEEGVLLHARALHIVRDVEEAEAEASAQGDMVGGLLRVGAPSELGRRVIAPLLAQFRDRCPKLEVILVLSDIGLDPVDDELDLVLRNGMPGGATAVVRKILSSRRVVCATPAYLEQHGMPQTPDDLLLHDCIRLVRGRRLFNQWPFMEHGKRRTVQVRGSLSSTSGEALHDWILADKGLGLKALWDVQADLDSGLLIECLRDFWCDEIALYACFPGHAHMPRRVRAFADFLMEALAPQAATPAAASRS